MIDLSDRSKLAQIDKSGALFSTEQLDLQISQAWEEVKSLDLPSDYNGCNAIVVCGMGASWLGGHIAQHLFGDQLKVPLAICNDYVLPGFVNEKTLVLASSYSGTTEETIAGMEEAFTRRAKVITVSTGGVLESFAVKNSLPHYTFNPKYNPAKSPRMGVGYSLTALLGILKKLSLVHLDDEMMAGCTRHVQSRRQQLSPDATDNEAQKMAHALKGFIPVLISGGFLTGVSHLFSNQFNETSKSFSDYMQIPELNHHNLEGLAEPDATDTLKYIFIDSDLYDPRVIRRFAVSKDVVSLNHVAYTSYLAQGHSKLEQVFDVMQFGSYVTFYLAMLYQHDPSPNPWVDYFKAQLAKT